MSHDLRQYAKQTNFCLILGFIILLFVVGDGLIYVFYGSRAALMGLICLVGALLPVVLILVALWAIDWVAKRNH
jgi:hypothetical protein